MLIPKPSFAHYLPCAVIYGGGSVGCIVDACTRKVMEVQTSCYYLSDFGIKARVKEC